VLTPNTKQRSVVIERFIDLASHCMKLANYNAVMAIHLALNLGAVSRLKASWKGVSAKHLLRLSEIGTRHTCALTLSSPRLTSMLHRHRAVQA
jgi:GDP/GTP exchange factor required for growth at low temperature